MRNVDSTATAVASSPVRWLWPGYLARGTVAVLDGDPGTGKSVLGADLAARLSRGGEWPDGTPVGQPSNAGACSKVSTLKHCRSWPPRPAVPFVSAAPALNRRLTVHATGPFERRYDRSVFLKETEYADVPH